MPDNTPRRQEIPYGLRISQDCRYLEENPGEMAVLLAMMEGIVADKRLSAIAQDLNSRGYSTRDGEPWNQVSVFHMLPRLIDMGPTMFAQEEWRERRKHIRLAVS